MANEREAAEFISEICADLRELAERNGMPVLARILGLAELQAETEKRRREAN